MRQIRKLSESAVYLTGTVVFWLAIFQGVNVLHLKTENMSTPAWVIGLLVFFMCLAAVMDIADLFYKKWGRRCKKQNETARKVGIGVIIEMIFVFSVLGNMFFV